MKYNLGSKRIWKELYHEQNHSSGRSTCFPGRRRGPRHAGECLGRSVIYYGGLQYTKASVATLAELGFPMAAVVVNWYFLKQGLLPMQLVGMAVLLFAVFMLARENWAMSKERKYEISYAENRP